MSARKQLEAILAETARRKAAWGQVSEIIKDALGVVEAEAKRRGDHALAASQKVDFGTWYGSKPDTPQIFGTHKAYWFGAGSRGQYGVHFNHSGIVEAQSGDRDSDVHEGYPNINDQEVAWFSTNIVPKLVARLHEFETSLRGS